MSRACIEKRRGKIQVKYIVDKNKRNQTRSTRKTGLFKKALEYATMTGDSTRLEIRDEYFDSFKEGLVSDQSNAYVVITENQPPEDNDQSPGCSNVTMSPKAVKAAKDLVSTTDSEIQCSLIDTVGNNFGNERFCTICGRDYEADSRQEQKLWIGCTHDDCDYWLHVKCLLGKSKKITPKFCQCMPYLCPFHGD